VSGPERLVKVVRVELAPADAEALARLVADCGAAAGRPLGVTEAVRRLARLAGQGCGAGRWGPPRAA
jgi:hypothetical protein